MSQCLHHSWSLVQMEPFLLSTSADCLFCFISTRFLQSIHSSIRRVYICDIYLPDIRAMGGLRMWSAPLIVGSYTSPSTQIVLQSSKHVHPLWFEKPLCIISDELYLCTIPRFARMIQDRQDKSPKSIDQQLMLPFSIISGVKQISRPSSLHGQNPPCAHPIQPFSSCKPSDSRC